MRISLAGLLFCATVAHTADTPAQRLFDQARSRVLDAVKRSPRYTCVETITRTVHHQQYGVRHNCAAIADANSKITSKGLLMWQDRLRMDVAVSEGSEIFSWAGATKFETSDMETLAGGGSTGSGAFGSFLSSIFGTDSDHFSYEGELGGLALFNYNVPLKRSHYTYRMKSGADKIIPYRGSFYVVPATGELKKLEVVATEFPVGEACEVRDAMEYNTVRIGSGEFLLPEVSRMTVLHEDGQVALNETRFSKCREYVGESTIHFDGEEDASATVAAAKAALKSLAPKTRIKTRLETVIDSESSAAGDAVVAVVERDGKEKRQVVLRAGDKLHGRVLRLEHYLLPVSRWIVAIRFDSVEREGAEEPVRLLPMDDGDRSPRAGPGRYGNLAIPSEPKGAGIFAFTTNTKLVLDQKFRSEWEVAK